MSLDLLLAAAEMLDREEAAVASIISATNCDIMDYSTQSSASTSPNSVGCHEMFSLLFHDYSSDGGNFSQMSNGDNKENTKKDGRKRRRSTITMKGSLQAKLKKEAQRKRNAEERRRRSELRESADELLNQLPEGYRPEPRPSFVGIVQNAVRFINHLKWKTEFHDDQLVRLKRTNVRLKKQLAEAEAEMGPEAGEDGQEAGSPTAKNC